MSSDDIVRRMELMDVPPGSYDEETLYDAVAEIKRLRAAGDALAKHATHERGCFLPGLEQCWCGKSVASARWQEARRG